MLEPLPSPRQAQLSCHVVNGHKYRVAFWPAAGVTKSRPLLFFTGIGANIELLSPFLDRIGGRDVITFDMPGVGGSDEHEWPYRLSAMVDVAEQILSTVGYDDVDVMGVSWGGMLAQEFAYRHRNRALRLILAATSPGIPMVPGSLLTMMKMASPQRYAGSSSIAAYLQTLYGGGSRNLETYPSRMTPPSSTGYLHQLLAIAGWTSVRKLTCISAETLILMGEDDRLLPPANGKILKFLLPDARLKIIEDAGHLFVLTHLEAVVDMIEAFLDRPATKPRPAQLQSMPGSSFA